jgi:transcriptional regulator
VYQPPHHREEDLIRANPLGMLVTYGAAGLSANPIPFILDDSQGEFGCLQAHLARANPQWRDFDPKVEALVIFQGAQSYITPSWYPTKQATGKVVPTWNYVTVQVHGMMRVIEDTDWLRRQIDALTALKEQSRPLPWAVEDAPIPFIQAQLKGIVGIEIPISRIEGKWKISQNRPEADRAGVIEGLEATGDGVSRAMADPVRVS